jgi:hypothetical protein
MSDIQVDDPTDSNIHNLVPPGNTWYIFLYFALYFAVLKRIQLQLQRIIVLQHVRSEGWQAKA